jgi:hypothetical protein
MRRSLYCTCRVVLCFTLGLLLSSCSSTQSINFKIHTDPEGSHVVYKISRNDAQAPTEWIYLGVTPYKGVTLFHDDALEDNATISIKVMQNGYLDQVKEWNGEQFLEEYEKQGMIFWTPHLVRSN